MGNLLELMGYRVFTSFVENKDGKESVFSQPHTIKADPPMKVPDGIKRIADAFAKGKEVSIGKEIDSKSGGEKSVTMKAKKLYVVGGAVRDYMLGHTPKGYDLATDAHPEEVIRILQQARPPIRVVKQDPKEGVTHVSLDGETYEIKTLKKKPNPDADEDGAVFTVNPAEDSENRDLTINALYYDVQSNQIIDHCGGIRHLKDGTIRPVGNADEKFKSNGMHKYRALRMMNILPNGRIDDDVKSSLVKAAGSDDDIPPEKIREEFLKGLEHAHTNVKKYIQSYVDHGLLEKVFPHLELNTEFPDCGTCKNRSLALAFLLKKNKPAKLVKQLRELKYSDREIKDAVYLINLLWFGPDYVVQFKRELLTTSLSKRQLLDWAKLNDLDKEMIHKLVDYNFKVNDQDVMSKEGLQGDQLRARVNKLEADEFKKTLSKE